MTDSDNATTAGGVTAAPGRAAVPAPSAASATRRTARRLAGPGFALGALGILGFSFSLPATRLAVAGLDPWLVAFGRAAVAAALAAVYLRATRAPRPGREHARSLLVVAGGVIVGFPLFTSLALEGETAAHGAVVIGALPAATAVAAVARAGERPSRAFLAASAGAGLRSAGPQTEDLYLLAGTALCAIGYAEGGALSRDLGGPRTICWALVASAPVTAAVAAAAAVASDPAQ